MEWFMHIGGRMILTIKVKGTDFVDCMIWLEDHKADMILDIKEQLNNNDVATGTIEGKQNKMVYLLVKEEVWEGGK